MRRHSLRHLFLKILFSIVIATATVTLYAQVPTITSFTPVSGPIGTAVTISGTNFSTTPADNIVWFGAVRATVNSASATSLNVTVPAGTSYQPVSVTVTGTTAYSSEPFSVTFPSKRIIDTHAFSKKVDFISVEAPWTSGYIGDIDSDGKPDLIVANQSDRTISIYRNTSSSGLITASSFSAKVDLVTSSAVYDIAIGDIDGDGKLDLSVANFNSNTISVFRNSCTPGSITSGSFDPRIDFDAGSNPWSVALGDIDGDGKPDLAVTNVSSGTVSVFRNTSTLGSLTTGSFALRVDFATGAGPMSDVTLGDIDGDGKPDLAVANYGDGKVSIFRNTSTSGSVNSGSFSTKVDFITGSEPSDIIIGDIDGDDKQDLVTVNRSSFNISIFRNTSIPGSISSSTFDSSVDFVTGSYPSCVALGDVDGDGKPDLAVANRNDNTVSVFRNTSIIGTITSSSFGAKVDFATDSYPNSVAIGDLDDDGKPDLFVRNDYSNTVSVLHNIISEPIPPVIASFSPAAGLIGSLVTITGTNFIANPVENTVFFGTVPATVTAASTTQLTVTVPPGAPTQPIYITVNGFTTNTSSLFTVTLPPTISSFSPSSGPVGTTVTINGSNFSTNISNNIVKFGTVQAAVILANTNQISFIVPAGATTQPVSLTVNELTTTTGTAFSVTLIPTLTTFSPATGPVGTTVTINGSNYSAVIADNIVKFGTVQAVVTSGTGNQLTVTVPAGATTQPISVTVTGLTATSSTSFEVTVPPIITSFSPANGPIGTTVTIDGSNFSINISNNIVKFGTVRAAVISATSSQLSVIVPSGATSQPISVTVDELTAFSGTSFSVTVPPTIVSISPLFGPIGTEVTITGTNFSNTPSENTVLFGAIAATVTTSTATQMTVTVPAGATTQPISVIVTGLTSLSSTSFTVTIPPVIMSFSPASGPVGTTVTINGSNFSTNISNNIVKFGTVQGAVISATSTQISVIVPAGATSQPISLTVDELTVYTTTSYNVTIPPSITSFSPTSGPVGTIVTITGTNFSIIPVENSLLFGASPATASTATSTQLTVTVPPGATSQPISLTVNGLTTNSGSAFTVTTPPTIMSFMPISGPVGATVFINGTNFSPIISNNIVKFGTFQAAIVTATSSQLSVIVPSGAITQPISVTTDGLTATTLSSFSVVIPPTIISFTPASGPVGTEVTITGTNFSVIPAENSVSFGPSLATVTAATSTQLTVSVPAGATTQQISLMVNGLPTTSGTSFTVTVPPNIMTFMPLSGQVGTTVTINGSNFSSNISNNTVKFGTVQAAIISASTLQLVVIVPAGATSQPISVTTDGLTAPTITSFDVVVPPAITSFTPLSGPVGTTVTIDGTNFSLIPADNIVRFGTELAVVSSATSTQLTVIVPAGATTQPISVTTNLLTAISLTNFTVTASVSDPPVITSFDPASGVVGTTVIISGSNFSTNISDNIVKFGSVQAAVISASTTILTVIVPSGATTQPVYVTVNGLTAYTSVSFVINVPPVITSFSPASGPVGTTVLIEGSNFGSTPDANTVLFGTVSAAVSAVSLTQLTVIVPVGATTQLIHVTSNGLTTNSGTTFTVTASAADPPIITSFSPASGPAGTTVTIVGSNFGSDIASNIVMFGTVAATVTSATSEQLSVVVPLVSANQPIYVTVNGLTAYSSTSFIFTFPPVITSFSPLSGPVGTSVTIYGSNFGPAPSDNTVMFGAVQATVTAATTTQLTVTVPAISFSQLISVTVNGLTANSMSAFTVVTPPTVTSFSPSSGTVGTNVTITGSDFSSNISNNNVMFGNVQAAVISATTNQLTVIVPAGTTNQPISVTVNGMTTTSGESFIIIYPPVINSFNPQSGPVGTSVTISGANFSTTAANNTVRFGSVQATVNSATDTQLTVTVPAGAITQPISVTVNGLTAYSSSPFNIPPPQPPIINSFFPTSGPVGTTVTITGMNFSNIPADNNVMFGGNQATVTEASGTELTVTVPNASGNFQISIVVNGLTGNSNNPFNITAAGETPSVNSFAFESSVITLNGDGVNDRLVIQNFETYGKCDISIYNSRGLLIFSQKDYQNDWDMTINGRQLITGGYFYVAQTEKGVFRGSFSILTQF